MQCLKYDHTNIWKISNDTLSDDGILYDFLSSTVAAPIIKDFYYPRTNDTIQEYVAMNINTCKNILLKDIQGKYFGLDDHRMPVAMVSDRIFDYLEEEWKQGASYILKYEDRFLIGNATLVTKNSFADDVIVVMVGDHHDEIYSYGSMMWRNYRDVIQIKLKVPYVE